MSITSVVLTKEQKSIIAEALEVMPEDLEEIKIKANSYKKRHSGTISQWSSKAIWPHSPGWI